MGRDEGGSYSFLIVLNPNESSLVTVKVKGSDYLPAGAHESTILQAIPLMHDGKNEEIELISVVPVRSPFITHDANGWAEVKRKVDKYDWAKQELQEFIQVAEAFKVPEVRKAPCLIKVLKVWYVHI